MSISTADTKAIAQICRQWMMRLFSPDRLLHNTYHAFREVLRLDSAALDLLTDLESHLSGRNAADPCRIRQLCQQAIETVGAMAESLQTMTPSGYRGLSAQHARLAAEIMSMMAPAPLNADPPYTLSLMQAADVPDLVGGKAANLSAAGRAGVVIPRGFVITARAFNRFILENRFERKLQARFQLLHAEDNETIISVAGDLQELILSGEVPDDIREQIEKRVLALGPMDALAVRSSALAEDGQISFAGQYASELDVPPGDIVAAYKRVIAGKYCPRAIRYRILHGLSDADTTMAALVVPMVSPQAAGVVYTLDPGAAGGEEGCLGIYAVAGLAEGLVNGSQTPETYQLGRDPGIPLHFISPSPSSTRLLRTNDILQLQAWGMQLEHFFGCPQDIEWALDETGLTVLQSRRLHQQQDPPPALVEAMDIANLLYSNLHCAAPGTSCGPVFSAPTGKAYLNIPAGSVVLTPTLRPSLSQFLDRIAGVVAESGSRASHFASVARERDVPVVVGEKVWLKEGQVVTVDASSGRIFNGCVKAVLQAGRQKVNKDFPAEKFRELAARTVHLGLIDLDGNTFTPDECRSLHDIVRFCHEKSVLEMFNLVDSKGRELGKARKLSTDLPLVMYVLDLENTRLIPAGDSLSPEKLSCLPMRAFWQGMSDRRIYWDTTQHHVDWEKFDQISGGILPLDSQLLASYAVVSADYLHLDIRFGYHFSTVDTICGESTGINYISFRFKGGGAAYQQQLFRLEFIEQVLTTFGFETSRRGDLLDASLARASLPATQLALTRLGLLLAFTRLMDMKLVSSQQAKDEAELFIAFAGKNL